MRGVEASKSSDGDGGKVEAQKSVILLKPQLFPVDTGILGHPIPEGKKMGITLGSTHWQQDRHKLLNVWSTEILLRDDSTQSAMEVLWNYFLLLLNLGPSWEAQSSSVFFDSLCNGKLIKEELNLCVTSKNQQVIN